MVAIPITNDQPGVAARIKWSGCGEFIESKKLAVEPLNKAIRQVLGTPAYAANAARLNCAIAERGGACQAAELVEAAVSSKSVTGLRPEGASGCSHG